MNEQIFQANSEAIIEDIVRTCQDVTAPVLVQTNPLTLAYTRIDRLLELHDIFVVRIDTVIIHNKDDLLMALYQNGGFPSYFGFNWDALEEALSDFSWCKARGFALIFKEPRSLDISTWEIFRGIVNSVGADWVHRGLTFKLLVPG